MLRECPRRAGWRRARRLVLAGGLAWLALPASAQTPEGIGMAEPPFAGSGLVLREEQWARSLVRALALDGVLPEHPADAELFALLCADEAEMATDAEGRRVPTRAAFRIGSDTAEARAPGEPVRIVLDVPATALYQLSVEGQGKQRWTIDQRKIGHLDPTDLGVAYGPRVVPLREGPHELAGYLTRDGRVTRVELTAHRPLCIAPADGWQVGRPLTAGAEARTLVRALGLEGELPEARTVVSIEGEDFSEASDWAGRSNAAPEGAGETRPEWARAGESPAQFAWRVRLPEPGVFSVHARVLAGVEQVWSVDGRYRTRVRVPSGEEPFVWVRVMTTSLVAGDHVIRALIPAGSGIDRIRIAQQQALDADYVEILEQMGFRIGGPRALVTRGAALDALAHPAFQELADDFLAREAGRTPETPLVALDDRVEPLYTRPLSPVLPADL